MHYLFACPQKELIYYQNVDLQQFQRFSIDRGGDVCRGKGRGVSSETALQIIQVNSGPGFGWGTWGTCPRSSGQGAPENTSKY